MAEHFSFFDPVEVSPGVWDREYNAPQFTKYFGALVTTGVMKGMGNMLAVSTNGSNMVTKINTGIAFIEGKYYENDSFLDLTHDTETLGKDRIDRIVIRMDESIEARYVKAFIKKGVPSTNPVAPPLTQSPNLYEISLAQVKIVGGQTFIATDGVIDERGTPIVCPWAASKILPSYDENSLATHMHDYLTHTPYVKAITTGNGHYDITLDGVDSYVEGMSIAIKPNMQNTITTYFNINGLGPIRAQDQRGLWLISGYLRPDMIYTFRYSGQYFVLQGVQLRISSALDNASYDDVASSMAVKTLNDRFNEPTISLNAVSPFRNDSTGIYVKKTGKIVSLIIRVQASSQLAANTIYRVCDDLPTAYRPSNDSFGFLGVAISGVWKTLPVFVDTTGSVFMVHNPTVVPINLPISGVLTFVTNN